MRRTLPLLQNPEYHRESLYGYVRGTEAVSYIRKVMIYYDILKRRDIEYRLADSTADPGAV